MGSGAAWLKLAHHARAIANDMRNAEDQKTMREIAAAYETLARRDAVRDVQWIDET
jgi:hypothetical protein